MAERVTLYKGDKIFYGGDMANQSDFGTVTRVIPLTVGAGLMLT